MTEFITGLAAGLEIEIGNPAECAKDINITEQDLINGYALIKKGIADLSIGEIEKGLQDWSAALMEVNVALTDCGAGNITKDIENILKEINSGIGGVTEFILHELLAIIENDVRTLFDDAIAATEANPPKWYEAGDYTGQILGILLNNGYTKTQIISQ